MTPQSGDRCPRCGNRLSVYATRTRNGVRTQYIGCRKYGNGRRSGCGYRPSDNVVILVHASTIPRSASNNIGTGNTNTGIIHQTTTPDTTRLTDDKMKANMLTVNEAARRLGLHRNTVCRDISRGVLPGVRIGGAVRIPRLAIEALERGEAPETDSPKNPTGEGGSATINPPAR